MAEEFLTLMPDLDEDTHRNLCQAGITSLRQRAKLPNPIIRVRFGSFYI